MYTRQKPHISPVHVPENYSGNAFKRGDDMPPLPYTDRRDMMDSYDTDKPENATNNEPMTDCDTSADGSFDTESIALTPQAPGCQNVAVSVTNDLKSASPLSFFSGKEDDILIFAIIFILIKGGCDDIMIILLLLFLL